MSFVLLWLAAPFVLMVMISHHEASLRILMRVYPAGIVLGGVGAVAMVVGLFVLRGSPALVLYVVGAPLCALAVFSPRSGPDDGGDDDGGRGGGGDGPPRGDGEGPPFDWPEFERAFWAHVSRSRQPVR